MVKFKVLFFCISAFLFFTGCVKDYNFGNNPVDLPVGDILLEEPRDVAANNMEFGEFSGKSKDSGFLIHGDTTIWPASGRVSSEYGRRKGRFHRGIDIAARQGSPIFAAKKGRVEFVGRRKAYGLTVVIRHNDGTQTLYAHCKKLKVKKNEMVRMGQTIAYVGRTGNATGAHLHFEYMLPDSTPINPRVLFPTENIVQQ